MHNDGFACCISNVGLNTSYYIPFVYATDDVMNIKEVSVDFILYCKMAVCQCRRMGIQLVFFALYCSKLLKPLFLVLGEPESMNIHILIPCSKNLVV